MPAATFTHSVTTSATVAQAWAALQRPETWAGIGPVSSVSDPTYGEDGTLMSFNWIADLGGKAYMGVATTTAHTEPTSFELTMDTPEIVGEVVASLEPTGTGCSITVRITLTTKGMLSAMFFPAIRQNLASGFPKQVDDLVASI